MPKYMVSRNYANGAGGTALGTVPMYGRREREEGGVTTVPPSSHPFQEEESVWPAAAVVVEVLKINRERWMTRRANGGIVIQDGQENRLLICAKIVNL